MLQGKLATSDVLTSWVDAYHVIIKQQENAMLWHLPANIWSLAAG